MTEMTEDAQQEAQLLRAEVVRLQKIIKVLMDKAERSASLYCKKATSYCRVPSALPENIFVICRFRLKK